MKLNEVKDKDIIEEGERMVPAFHKGAMVYGEHMVRYESVLPIIEGKTVLDIASGSGYGTKIISTKAKKVYGVEIEKEAVEYAERNYGAKNIDYIEGSAEKIPLDDDSVDVVVTFETIEHIKNYKKFLDEIKRVLKPDGVAVISTPNDDNFPEGNHFHLHEFRYKELRDLLKKYFKHQNFTFQYTWLYTAVLETDSPSEGKIEVETDNYTNVDKDKSIYFTVLCSDKPLSNYPKLKELAAIAENWSAVDQKEIVDGRGAAEDHIVELRNVIKEERGHIKNQDEFIEELKGHLKNRDDELEDIYSSKGWKFVKQVHATKQKIRNLFGRG